MFSPESRYLAFGNNGSGGGTVQVIDVSDREPNVVFSKLLLCTKVTFHPSGRFFATNNGSRVEIRRVPQGEVLKEWQFPGTIGWHEFADDGRHLFTHNSNGTIYVLRLSDLAGK